MPRRATQTDPYRLLAQAIENNTRLIALLAARLDNPDWGDEKPRNVLTPKPACGRAATVSPTMLAATYREVWPESSSAQWAKDQARRQIAPRLIAQKVEIIKRVGAQLKWTCAREIHPGPVMDYLTQMGEMGHKPKTINNTLSALNTWGKWLAEREEVTRNPFEAIRPSRTFGADSYRALSMEEVRTLVAVADADEAAETPRFTVKRALIYRLAYGTGLRRGEIMQLRIEDIELAATPPRIRIRAKVAKTRRQQHAMVPPWLLAPLRAAMLGRESRDLLFEKFPHPRVFDGDFADAGLGAVSGQRATFHSLRKSYVTMLALSGSDPVVTQKLARHSDPRMTSHVYTDQRLLPLGQAVMALPDPSTSEISQTGEKIREKPLAPEQDERYLESVQSESVPMTTMTIHHDQLEARPVSQGTRRTEHTSSGSTGGRASSGRDTPAVQAEADENGRNRTRTCYQPPVTGWTPHGRDEDVQQVQEGQAADRVREPAGAVPGLPQGDHRRLADDEYRARQGQSQGTLPPVHGAEEGAGVHLPGAQGWEDFEEALRGLWNDSAGPSPSRRLLEALGRALVLPAPPLGSPPQSILTATDGPPWRVVRADDGMLAGEIPAEAFPADETPPSAFSQETHPCDPRTPPASSSPAPSGSRSCSSAAWPDGLTDRSGPTERSVVLSGSGAPPVASSADPRSDPREQTRQQAIAALAKIAAMIGAALLVAWMAHVQPRPAVVAKGPVLVDLFDPRSTS